MPLYDYHCAGCGPFQAWRPMSEADAAGICPVCAASAARIVLAPYLNTMRATTRIAHERNERSADEPRVMSRAELDRHGRRRQACAHDHAADTPRGSRLEPGAVRSPRRWMIGH